MKLSNILAKTVIDYYNVGDIVELVYDGLFMGYCKPNERYMITGKASHSGIPVLIVNRTLWAAQDFKIIKNDKTR